MAGFNGRLWNAFIACQAVINEPPAKIETRLFPANTPAIRNFFKKSLFSTRLVRACCPACSLIADPLCIRLPKEFFFWRLTSCPAAV